MSEEVLIVGGDELLDESVDNVGTAGLAGVNARSNHVELAILARLSGGCSLCDGDDRNSETGKGVGQDVGFDLG